MNLDEKRALLGRMLRDCGSAAIAFSGGVDSSFLCAAARDELGEDCIAYTIVSPMLPRRELDDAQALARLVGVRHILLHAEAIEEPVAANTKERCYHCKMREFSAIQRAAADLGITAVLDGSNVDDEGDYRPGMRALSELGIRSPLREAGLAKAEIRELSRRRGLPTAEKPSFACLASRLPYGERIDAAKLRRVELAEEYLRELGFSQYRVRSFGNQARIEVGPEERRKFFSEELLDRLSRRMSDIGFLYSSFDLAGYRQGNLNKVLDLKGGSE